MKKEVKRIVEFLDAVDWAFGLNIFKRTITLEENDHIKEERLLLIQVKIRKDYQDIEFIIFPIFFQEDLQDQRKILLHELCHSITLPSKQAMSDLHEGKLITPETIRKINETETSKIENILDRLLDNELLYFKKAYKNYLKLDTKNK